MSNFVEQVVEYSKHNKLSHIPSALSMLTYIETLFVEKYIVPGRDKIVLGKPFGSQAYYIVWKSLGYISEIESLSIGVKHKEISFVDYGEETMGNALGVATGIAIANPDTSVWVNLTDATLQMGSTLEALQYIGHNQISNLVVTVDFNNMQVTGETSDVLTVDPIIQMCEGYNWNVNVVDGHDRDEIKRTWCITDRPDIYFYVTAKGFGVDYMMDDPITWHYKTISV